MNDSDARVASVGHSVASPSGDFQLTLVRHEETDDLTFEIQATSGSETFRPDVSYSERFRTYILWDDQVDRVWAYSGDVGTTIWTWDGNGWRPQPWVGSGLTAPRFLREQLPKRFA